MNKYIISSIIALSFIIPAVSLAQSADVDTSGDTTCAIISINLRYSSRDASTGGAVSVLQDFLNSHGYLSIQPTGFFGSMTRSAVIAFQNANGISATPPGFVGSLTRAKIQAIDCNGSATSVTNPVTNPVQSVNTTPIITPAPTITPTVVPTVPTSPQNLPLSINYLSQSSASGGETITVYGQNFTADSVVNFRQNGNVTGTLNGKNIQSVSSKQLIFTFDKILASNSTLGTYQLTVSNSNSRSNAVNFTITNTPPTITSISANSGQANDIITIYGTGFMNKVVPSVVEFLQNGQIMGTTNPTAKNPNAISSDGTQLQFVVDPIFVANGGVGTYQIRVSNNSTGNGVSNTVPFTINVPAPHISSISQSSGGAGSTITIYGTNLANKNGDTQIDFLQDGRDAGGTLASYIQSDGTQLQFRLDTILVGMLSGGINQIRVSMGILPTSVKSNAVSFSVNH
jgi:peptidoglycan hydrolase-like protein with peptidoglycan-binding domain